MSVLDKTVVLKLNKNWAPIGITTPKHAFGEMFDFDDKKKEYKLLAFDIRFAEDGEGGYIYDQPEDARVVNWDEWITLPIRNYDLSITTGKGLKIRVPTVTILPDYAKLPPDKEPPDKIDTYWKMYNGRCAYTNKKLTRKKASLDHVIPKSRGGSNHFSNKVLADVEFNNRKGDSLNSELGIPDPKILIPKRVRVVDWIADRERHPSWQYFLLKK